MAAALVPVALALPDTAEIIARFLNLEDVARCQRTATAPHASLNRTGLWNSLLEPCMTPQKPIKIDAPLLEPPQRGTTLRCFQLLRRATFAEGLRMRLTNFQDVRRLGDQLAGAFRATAAHRQGGNGGAHVAIGRFDVPTYGQERNPRLTCFALDSLPGLAGGIGRGQMMVKLAMKGNNFIVGAKYFGTDSDTGIAARARLQLHLTCASRGVSLSYRGVDLRMDQILRHAEHGVGVANRTRGMENLLCVLCLMDGTPPPERIDGRVARALQLDCPQDMSVARPAAATTGVGASSYSALSQQA